MVQNIVKLYEDIKYYNEKDGLDPKDEHFILEAKKDGEIIPNVSKNDKLFFKVTNKKEYGKYCLYRIDGSEFGLIKIDKLTNKLNFEIVGVLVKIVRDFI